MDQALPGITAQSNENGAASPVSTAPKNGAKPYHFYVLWLSGVAAIGGFLFGFDSGVINGAVDALSAAFGTKTAATGSALGNCCKKLSNSSSKLTRSERNKLVSKLFCQS